MRAAKTYRAARRNHVLRELKTTWRMDDLYSGHNKDAHKRFHHPPVRENKSKHHV